MATFAPSLASPSAEAYPSPLLAAATNATLPFRPSSIKHLLHRDHNRNSTEKIKALYPQITQMTADQMQSSPQITQISTDFGSGATTGKITQRSNLVLRNAQAVASKALVVFSIEV
jgi:hypothetical protein